MITKHLLMLSGAAALTAIAAGTASSQTSPTTPPPTTTRAFLAPLPARLMVPSPYSTFCRQVPGRRCPPVLVYGGAAGGGLPTIEGAFKANLPNIRVSFVLQEISNTAVANGGINGDPFTFVEWTTTSSAASVEHSGPYDHPLPPPGVPWDADDLSQTVIYDALVFNACDNFASFPVQHDALIQYGASEIGAFHGVDNSTLDHTGFYNFNYTARATAAGGKVSDFRFSGKVNVTCSGLNALP
jgi:hypothetical protein